MCVCVCVFPHRDGKEKYLHQGVQRAKLACGHTSLVRHTSAAFRLHLVFKNRVKYLRSVVNGVTLSCIHTKVHIQLGVVWEA